MRVFLWRLCRLNIDDRRRQLIVVGTASALTTAAIFCDHGDGYDRRGRSREVRIVTPYGVDCEEWSDTTQEERSSSRARQEQSTTTFEVTRPSWTRRALAALRVLALPIPRLLANGDPAFHMNPGVLHRRQENEVKLQELVRTAIHERRPETLLALNDKCLELAYGKGVTLKSRQDFVHRHGCTAWTDDALNLIVELGKTRGVVEIGAGNGQWARAIMGRHRETCPHFRETKKYDFVLAYDDKSELPLDQTIFNKKTKVHHDYFYDKVKQCDSKNFSNTLRQWECRGRLLLLVYPPPGSMAFDAVRQYTSASWMNDTVVYVGEGRQGANANDALFDEFENGHWVLMNVMDVKPLGSHGHEKLYVLQRKLQHY